MRIENRQNHHNNQQQAPRFEPRPLYGRDVAWIAYDDDEFPVDNCCNALVYTQITAAISCWAYLLYEYFPWQEVFSGHSR